MKSKQTVLQSLIGKNIKLKIDEGAYFIWYYANVDSYNGERTQKVTDVGADYIELEEHTYISIDAITTMRIYH